MSRRRYVSTDISTDKVVNQLAVKHGDFAALFYTWLIPHAEDNATFPADPEELLMKVCPGRRDKEIADVEAAIAAMLSLGLVERCADPRRLRFPKSSFYKHQSYITEARRGAPEAAPDAAPSESSAQSSEDQRNSAQIIASSSFSFSDSLRDSSGTDAPVPAPVSPIPIIRPSEISQQVAEVWAYYQGHIQPKARVCPESKIRSRIKRFGVPTLKEAIDRFKTNWWWMTHNAKQGAEWFFSSDSQIDRFLLLEPETEEDARERENGRANGRALAASVPDRKRVTE